MFNRILVAMDDSAEGDHIFEEALSIAKTTNARLMLMHVLSDINIECVNGYKTSTVRSPDRFSYDTDNWESTRQQGLETLRARHAVVFDAGISADIGLPTGHPGCQICEMAQNWGADLILLGRRGFTDPEEDRISSVSNYVLHHAPCAVLVVPRGTKIQPTSPQQHWFAAPC